MGGGLGQVFGDKKYLWGNVPAFDVLQLEKNEGADYSGPLRILFAGISLAAQTLVAHLTLALTRSFRRYPTRCQNHFRVTGQL
jgi:hypothetical protein